MTSFNQLGLSSNILKALNELGFEEPSEIQTRAIPELMQKETDFIGLAQTGTGKTAAFGIPLLEKIDSASPHTQALILAPTRELGKQIAEQLELYAKHSGKISLLPVYGGAAISNQIKALKKPQHVIIATPGRLIDLLHRKALKVDQLKYLILDEADEMLNMGFKEEIDEILRYTGSEKNTWLFSATMPKEIRRIVKTYMHEPIEVAVKANTVNADIEHQYSIVNQRDRAEALTRFMDIDPEMRGVVFCRTKRDTQNLAETLMKSDYKADALHGDLSQAQRDRVMRRFKDKEIQLLIATDVAARGIDVNNLSHVFHLNLPDDVAYYTHRSGRTARAGKKGISMAFISPKEQNFLRRIAKSSGIEFEKQEVPKADDVAKMRVTQKLENIKNKKVKEQSSEINRIAHEILGDMSSEELIDKITAHELNKFDDRNRKDLNSSAQKGGDDRGGDGRRKGKRPRKFGGSKNFNPRTKNHYKGNKKKNRR